jgi:hypothetical protein
MKLIELTLKNGTKIAIHPHSVQSFYDQSQNHTKLYFTQEPKQAYRLRETLDECIQKFKDAVAP